MENNVDFSSIDWNAMWAKAAHKVNRSDEKEQRELWDKRAESFAKPVAHSKNEGEKGYKDYITNMLERIEVRPDWTVLDIGSGPGTLAIPLAEKVRSVTALDISSRMLERLQKKAFERKLSNISYINVSFQEAMAKNSLNTHDVIVASRSLMSMDMKPVLEYLNSIARQAVYLTLPVVHLPFDWEAYRAIGREDKNHASYIYVYNMLFQIGITANVEILYSKIRMQFSSVEKAIEDIQWRTDPFTPEETRKLRLFLEEKFKASGNPDGFTHEGFSQWALIWWKKYEGALL